jgi:hypothetical protein
MISSRGGFQTRPIVAPETAAPVGLKAWRITFALQTLPFVTIENPAIKIFLALSLFKRQPVFAFGIAFFAASHDIAFGGFAAANDRHQVIHRQLTRWKSATTMMTEAGSAFALPPLAGTQLSSLSAFTANFFFTDRD